MAKKKVEIEKAESMPKKINPDNIVHQKIEGAASKTYQDIMQSKRPSLSMPVRSLANVKFDKDVGYFELLDQVKERTLTVNTIKSFAQTLLMMNEARNLVDTNDAATKREIYYVSKNWGECKFDEQPESDTIMDDVEAMLGVNREMLGFFPEEKGGAVAGELIVVDKDRDTNEVLEIDCTKFGSGAYSIPSSVEHLEFRTKAKFILAIETSGAFERLNNHKYWKKANCILVAMGGVPTRATRRFIRKLTDSMKIPVFVFTDGDPYGYLNIYRTLKVGSGNAAHINKYFCVPNAKFIGVTPQDIIDFDLPTHALKEVDVKRIKDGMKNDPFVQENPEWQKALDQMVKMKKRVEQQAFAKHGLNSVMDVYLPKKLGNPKTWLP